MQTEYPTSSPLAITMLLHFYAKCDPFIDAEVSDWPPAQQSLVSQFIRSGLIYQQQGPGANNVYITTPKGARVVALLKGAMRTAQEVLAHE